MNVLSTREEKWQNLTLADDFLFCKIMSYTALCAEMRYVKEFVAYGMTAQKAAKMTGWTGITAIGSYLTNSCE